jgi:hypothetical protein
MKRFFHILILTVFFVESGRSQEPDQKQKPVHHMISWNLVPLRYNAFSINYEYVMFRNHIGLKATSFFGNPEINNNDYQRASTISSYGIDLNFYLNREKTLSGKTQFFIAPAFEYGTFRYGFVHKDVLYYEPQSFCLICWDKAVTQDTQKNAKGYYTTVLFKGGFFLNISKHFYGSASLGVGGIFFNRNYLKPDFGYKEEPLIPSFKIPQPYTNGPVIRTELNLGVKF